ncbi:MAG: hypothetical protein RL328_1918, partial [Acidobacteriota bacterium]
MTLRAAMLGLVLGTALWAQEPSVDEQQALMQALRDASSSPVDAIRALEGFLVRYPQTTQRSDVEQALAKASLEAQDWNRLIQYGEPLLKAIPDDVILLDRVSFALLA